MCRSKTCLTFGMLVVGPEVQLDDQRARRKLGLMPLIWKLLQLMTRRSDRTMPISHSSGAW